MDSESISIAAGILLSLAASYAPGFAPWYEALTKTHKRLVMLAALLAVSLAVFGISCLKLEPWVACDGHGAWALFKYFVAAAIANQAAYLLSPEKEAPG
jgi:hypothetical protein